ncbi:Uncharacterised protein [Vibrio cholerae]|uniref:Uncharacterized protein n=1 Tax=Vibrio cholerae TaxID=666 RepID=A0A060KYK4_VIBCL|nr:hypothetical protein [Vibrio cholerae]AIC64174.1 hypothetical protein [Vibrio cholerae]AIC64202.1 hypothetical protein [Vibrio cholerae]KKP13214.1 hypothetical protein VS84_02451 [Vibrio cholerae]KKP20826.1 hypothetical protein VS86_01314 [Vibrio cholerae]
MSILNRSLIGFAPAFLFSSIKPKIETFYAALTIRINDIAIFGILQPFDKS